ncbi:tRNA uridine-5-carboxymethylaminomethyl(34) synthesis GTPase MnmE [Oceanomicrobium pacificus]|uniref:tRNA modification GTPase MnmE n=1 Tax=Oceanomicrobium pacificus TaxID=2692916 RepID=A0A6B0TUU5_9RHOB|nr:tRNA uridine-5-carboxymethylaminomethyl(34) synthesis GTPase MnmE [Oceanomicrobium pacificus]MXU64713.1 tRNA uridine-5-carboxymethylaminomethyl(34) synthesis GTPase MnmE [Oceanomicrobium pacificus]
MNQPDTIFARASAAGAAGVAVLRLSGGAAKAAAAELAGDLPPARQAGLRLLRDPGDGSAIDQALVLVFDAPASFTGEDVVEFHLHGSPAVVAAVGRILAAQPGLRLADPGEFTRRALDNGRLDLAQVEGLSDLVVAETEAQRRQALRVMRGALSEKAGRWRTDLVRAMALIEATIDFADEEVPEDVTPEVEALMAATRHALEAERDGGRVSERIRDGFEVAIVGKPNAGKSTLLNAIAGRDAAITSEIAGTTRDVIEVRMDLNGLPVTLLDTAGLRDSDDRVEQIGVARARDRADAADLRLFLLETPDEVEELGVSSRDGDVMVLGKADLGGEQVTGIARVSGKTGLGVDDLLDRLSETLAARASGASAAIRQRHRDALDAAAASLVRAENHVRNGSDFSELAAEDLRHAVRALDSLIGRVDVEHVLDEIFASFCLGK